MKIEYEEMTIKPHSPLLVKTRYTDPYLHVERKRKEGSTDVKPKNTIEK